VDLMMIYMKTSLNIYGKDQTTPNKAYSLQPLTHCAFSPHQGAESLSGHVLTTFTCLYVFTERLPWAMTQSCLYEGQSKPILVSKFTAYG